jgi:NAD(P)H-hydrate epimerase
LLSRFPEALYKRLQLSDVDSVLSLCEKQNAILVGSGSGCSTSVFEIIKALLEIPGAPIVIDADGINSIVHFGSCELLRTAKRGVILTPHPLEFSRLSGTSVDQILANRYSAAKSFAKEYGCVLLLKGAATVITDGDNTYINGSGSSALAKAGSGDVLSGLIVSILAYKKDLLTSAALAAYIHGRCGDELSREYSSYGVTPSDIPKKVAKIMAEIERGQ